MQISLADYVKRLKEASEILDALDEATLTDSELLLLHHGLLLIPFTLEGDMPLYCKVVHIFSPKGYILYLVIPHEFIKP